MRSKNLPFFLRRVPEPKVMGKIELDAFEEFTNKNLISWLIPLVDDIVKRFKTKKTYILDAACGPGLLTRELAQRSSFIQIVGVDIEPYAVKLAQKNCRRLDNATFRKGDIYHLPFPDHTFDVVVCKDSLHHFPSAEKAIREMMRVTKINGFIYIQDLRRDLPLYLLCRAVPPTTVIKKLQFYSTRAAYTKKEIRMLMQRIRIKHYAIYTRHVTHKLIERYRGIQAISPTRLRESFQSRYIFIINVV